MIIKKQVIVDVLPNSPSAKGYMLLHIVDSLTKTDVIRFMVDTSWFEYLQLFNWTTRYSTGR